jgi:segregation and condensation protein B
VGRPGLYATTKQFLDDLGINSLDQLPSLNDANEMGASIQRLEHLVDSAQLEIDLSVVQTGSDVVFAEPLQDSPIEQLNISFAAQDNSNAGNPSIENQVDHSAK